MQEKRTVRIIIKRKQKNAQPIWCAFLYGRVQNLGFSTNNPIFGLSFVLQTIIYFSLRKQGKEFIINKNKVVGGKYDERS